ncbi:MAG: hypothetical protein RMZ42_29880 [Nostoc sp. DedQUE05]|uniref:hypothetical protein n=1 Tax=Nostoc sp. DedQUE05 TaxID=3075391 RepID=UPI002AD462AF|nr:hypothetical protein [Nostoc sp. DedQUE05]MDZ8096112.1 hypothetical protein [Nostoc sp. DedQUE05]
MDVSNTTPDRKVIDKSKLERFTSLGEIAGEEVLSELFTLYSEPVSDAAEFGQNIKLASTT